MLWVCALCAWSWRKVLRYDLPMLEPHGVTFPGQMGTDTAYGGGVWRRYGPESANEERNTECGQFDASGHRRLHPARGSLYVDGGDAPDDVGLFLAVLAANGEAIQHLA